jgi:hypothetical protein
MITGTRCVPAERGARNVRRDKCSCRGIVERCDGLTVSFRLVTPAVRGMNCPVVLLRKVNDEPPLKLNFLGMAPAPTVP